MQVDISGNVSAQCDICKEDFGYSGQCGGLIYEGLAVCPNCAPVFEDGLSSGGADMDRVTYCPMGQPFGDWLAGNDVNYY